METVDIIILCVIMLVLGVFLGFCVLMALVFHTFCEKKRPVPTQKQKQKEPGDPCETCLRWNECMGEDETCPRRQDDGK